MNVEGNGMNVQEFEQRRAEASRQRVAVDHAERIGAEPDRASVLRTLLIVALVAAGYWGAARLAVMLTLPPGYATAVWPSAGIGLAAALIWGWRGLLGVALGAMAWNSARLLDWTSANDALVVLAPALGITIGALLQAGIGAWLIHKAVGRPVTLLQDKQVVRFMALGGPVSCLIGATTSVGTLALSDSLANDHILFSWFAWWVGDCIGVLTTAPLVLLFFGKPAGVWRHRRLSVGAPMVVTFSIAVFAFMAYSRSEIHQEYVRLERRADAISTALRSRLQNASNLVRACEAFYRGSNEVTMGEFRTFARVLLHESSGIRALSQVERISDNERDAFEAGMRKLGDGYSDFAIRDVVDNTSLAIAPRRPVYSVITAIEPLEQNREALGIDIHSRGQSLETMHRAVETGAVAISGPVALVQDDAKQPGVVLYLPRFAPGAPLETAAQRHAALVALNGAVVLLADLVNSSTTRFDLQEITLQLFDVTDPSQPQPLYIDSRTPSTLESETVENSISVGGRVWQLRVSRLEGYALSHQSLQSWIVLAGGLMLTSLLGGSLLIVTGRATLIRSLVEERTRELSLTNARLAHEQAASVQMMQQLKASRDAAEEADRTKTAFLANMTHEIRTPMTAILGYTDLLLDPQLSIDARSHYGEVIRRNGEHLLDIVNDILDVSKIEAGKIALESIPCSLAEIARDVQTMMHSRAQQKGIHLVVECVGEVGRPIQTDPVRVRQILINLVSNAIKFTERGSVTVHLERRAHFVEVSVCDTGIGMSSDQIEKIFEPFTQGDSSMTRRFGGTGLGLAISRQLSRLLGGDLTVQSELGKGSRFRLMLPAVDAEVAAASSAPIPQPKVQHATIDLKGKRILLAEDSSDVREFLRQVLTLAGAEVECAQDGERLLQAALRSDSDVDLILMDMQMPHVDGYEATRRIRAAGIRTPIIAITAHTLETDRTACLQAGCSDYLRKPIRRQMLLERIAFALGMGAAQPTEESGSSEGEQAPNQDDEALIAQLLPVFLQELDSHLQNLNGAIERRDVVGAKAVLHNIKGAAATFGFPQIGEAASRAHLALGDDPWGRSFELATKELIDLASTLKQPEEADTTAS